MSQASIILKARQDGYNDAVDEIRSAILTRLEELYMAPDVVRGTPKAEAILEVTRDLAEFIGAMKKQ